MTQKTTFPRFFPSSNSRRSFIPSSETHDQSGGRFLWIANKLRDLIKVRTAGLIASAYRKMMMKDGLVDTSFEEWAMEELNQVAGKGLCQSGSLYPTVLGSALAATIAIVLALCLGYF